MDFEFFFFFFSTLVVPFRQFPLVSALEPCLWCEECDLDTRRKTLKKKNKKINFEKKIFFLKVEDKAKLAGLW